MTEVQHQKLVTATAITMFFIWIAIGTFTFTIVEQWTVAQAFYFSVATLTTVGYGDIHPTTDLSRVLVSFYILIGVGISITAITLMGTAIVNRQSDHHFSIVHFINRIRGNE